MYIMSRQMYKISHWNSYPLLLKLQKIPEGVGVGVATFCAAPSKSVNCLLITRKRSTTFSTALPCPKKQKYMYGKCCLWS